MGKRIVSEEQSKAAKKRKKVERELLIEVVESIHSQLQPSVLEIGAHTGNMIELIYAWNESAKVFAVEPLDSNIKTLNSKFPNAKLSIFKGLIGSTMGKRELFISDLKAKKKNADCSMYKGSAEKNNAGIKKVITENTYTMEYICKELKLSHIDLLSINCEGGEYDIFESDNMDFLDNVDMIYMHMHTKSKLFLSDEYRKKRVRIMDLLANRGFTMQGMDDVDAIAHIIQLWKKPESNNK